MSMTSSQSVYAEDAALDSILFGVPVIIRCQRANIKKAIEAGYSSSARSARV